MAEGQGRSSNQGVKLLYIRDYLHKYTNKEHPKSAKEISEYLASKGIKADRKTIYNDILRLQMDFQEPIEYNPKKWGYYITAPQFTGAELALLIDCVRYAPFMTKDDAFWLTGKLKGLANIYDLPMLVQNTDQNGNKRNTYDSVLRNIQLLTKAIEQKRKIKFQQLQYVAEHTTHTTVEPETIIASPYELKWVDGRYILKYSIDFFPDNEPNEELVALLKRDHGDAWEQYYPVEDSVDEEDSIDQVDYECDVTLLSHVQIIDLPNSHRVKGDDPNKRKDAVMEMLHGKERTITIRFRKDALRQVSFDLGEGAVLIPVDEYHFKTTVRHRLDFQFCDWIASFGCRAKILSPQDAIDLFLAVQEDSLHHIKTLYEHDLEPIDLLTGEEFEALTNEQYEQLRPDKHCKVSMTIDENMKMSYVVKKDG